MVKRRRKSAVIERYEDSQRILHTVSDVTGINIDLLKSKCRREEVVAAKALYFSICRYYNIKDSTTADTIGLDRTMAIHYHLRYKPTQTFKQYKENYDKYLLRNDT